MIAETKPGTMKLSKEEAALVAAIRRRLPQHGRIPCVLHVQDGRLTRVEFKGDVESVKLGK